MDVVIGLGSNLGDRRRELVTAVSELRDVLSVVAVSSLYESAAVGPPQPEYLNAAVRGGYSGDAPRLLEQLLGIERRHGRLRRERWGPRPLDLDILWISRESVELPNLVVPHPRLAERAFALLPLLDVAPGAVDPQTGKALTEWLEKLPAGGAARIAGPEWAAG